MIPGADIADRAEQLLADPIGAAGFDLLLCQWAGASTGHVLRIFIERAGGETVTIDDCVKVNNVVSDLLDAEDFVATKYNLEVSSPGLDRPLKRAAHFLQQLGKTVLLRTWEPIEGRRNYRGDLLQVEGDLLTIEVDKQQFRIPVPAIERANLVYEHKPKGQKKGGNTRKKARGESRR